ncbi:N-6 DNA methylase [Undibacterium sp. TJN19]
MTLAPQLDLIRPGMTSDSWGRYYTAPAVSDILVNLIDHVKPKLIVELGVGQGSISSAAVRKWGGARLVTVDADHSTRPELSDHGGQAHMHYVQDALDDELANKIGLSFGSVDIGLCNPPYVRPKWRAGYGAILEEAGFSGALDSIHDAGADLLFIAQNLRFLKRKGKLGLILPDGLLTGQKFERVRAVLLRQHLIKEIVQLPRRVFSGTDAQTHLLVLAKSGGTTEQVVLRNLSMQGELSAPLVIPAEIAEKRLDYGFHFSRQSVASSTKRRKTMTIENMGASLQRGSFSSNQLDSLPVPIFHLSDFPRRLDGVFARVPKKFLRAARTLGKLPGQVHIAEPGDILIARIGRNLHDKICLVEGEGCVISDCIYALRVPPKYRDSIMRFFSSAAGRNALETLAHGVGAKYLSRSDVLQMALPL